MSTADTSPQADARYHELLRRMSRHVGRPDGNGSELLAPFLPDRSGRLHARTEEGLDDRWRPCSRDRSGEIFRGERDGQCSDDRRANA